MPTTGPPPAARRSEARERLLATASGLFYAEGIKGVGVERIIKEAGVSLATFYRHFPAKQDLVVAYLEHAHERIAANADAIAARHAGRELVRALGKDVTGQLARPGFRGCAFMNAAAEFDDPASPVRAAIAAHRDWYYRLLRGAFRDAGHDRPGNAARHFLMLRDGAMSAGYLETAAEAARTFRRGVDGLIGSIDAAPLSDDVDEP